MVVRFVGFSESDEMIVGFLLRLIDRELYFVRVAVAV